MDKLTVQPSLYETAHPSIAVADTNQDVIELWLHGKSRHSQRAYRKDVSLFLDSVGGKALPFVTINDLQKFLDDLERQGLELTTINRRLGAVKSLLTFAHKAGLIRANPGLSVRLRKAKDDLAERILSVEQVKEMIEREPRDRYRVILKMLYSSGIRVSELCGLRWRDFKDAGDPDCIQVTVYGKGDKTRVILFHRQVWEDLLALKPFNATKNDYALNSRQGKGITPGQVWNIVRLAGERIGIKGVSPHWLRHCHASHSLDNGANITLIQGQLGHSSIQTSSRYLHIKPGQSSSRFLSL